MDIKTQNALSTLCLLPLYLSNVAFFFFLDAPKVGTVNDQVRDAGLTPAQGIDMKTQNAISKR